MSKIEEGSKQQAKKAAKNAAKPAKKQQPTESTKAPAKASKVNDGMCCRCAWRSTAKACKNPKSPKNGQFVARKCSCGQFKRDN